MFMMFWGGTSGCCMMKWDSEYFCFRDGLNCLHMHLHAELCGYPGKTWLRRILCAIAESIYFVTPLYTISTSMHTYAI